MSTYTQDITHLIGKINTNLPDNDTQAITAARIRDAMGAVAYNYDLYVLKTDLDTAGYVTQSQLSESSYVTASQLEGLVTDQELQEGMQSVLDDSYAYVVDKINEIPGVDLSAYVTKTELSEAGYLTSIPSEYITDTELSNVLSTASYVTQNELSNAGYVSQTQLTQASYITNSDLSQASYVTQQALSGMGYITSSDLPDLSAYATLSYLETYYATNESLSDGINFIEDQLIAANVLVTDPETGDWTPDSMASQSYVADYVSTYAPIPDMSSYVTDTELSNMGYVTQTDLSSMSYATTSDLTSKQDTLVSGTNIKTINNESLLGSGNIDIQSGPDPDYSHVLTFTADQANSSVALNRMGSDTSLANAILQYSTDNGETWTNYTLGTSITLTTIGDSVMFKGTNATLGKDSSNYHRFTMTGKIKASGDVTSLLNETGGDMSMPTYAFYYLFYYCTSLTAAPNLPSMTLGDNCYNTMFRDCTSLTDAPELPATTLADNCYSSMFFGCTHLTKAPELPATTLTNWCYSSMFRGCTALTTSPKLHATTLAQNCYNGMFWGCTNLTQAPELPATTLTVGCYQNMFNTCTSLTTAPTLPATSLTTNCYSGMFYKCSSLKYIKAMFTTGPATWLTQNWVGNVAATGVFVKNNTATWTDTGTDGVPSGWTVYTTVNVDTDDVPESYVEDEGKTLQVVSGVWTKVTGGGGDMSAYVTKTELSSMGYLTAVPSEYVTETELSGMSYATQQLVSDTANMMQTVLEDANIVYEDPETGDMVINVMASESYVADYVASYAPSPDLSAYVDYNSLQSYLGSYVTKTELSAAGYLTAVPSEYVTETELSAMSYATTTYVADYVDQHSGSSNVINLTTNLTSNDNVQYFTISNPNYSSRTISFTVTDNNLPVFEDFEYKIGSNAWVKITSSSQTISLSMLSSVKFRGNSSIGICNFKFNILDTFNVSGDITTLINKNGNVESVYSYNNTGAFQDLFSNTKINSAKSLKLPKLYAGPNCFKAMFYGCTSLTGVPKLPTLYIDYGCYKEMFYGCTAITTAPEIDAVEFVYSVDSSSTGVCANMFEGCTSLVVGPELLIKTLYSGYEYQRMFAGCTSLKYVKMMAENFTNNGDWLYNVAQNGIIVKSYRSTLTANSSSGIPSGWSVIEVDTPTGSLPHTEDTDNGKGLQVVNGAWQKVSGLLTSANLIYDSTTNTLTINV